VIRNLKADLDDIKENHERLVKAKEEQEEINGYLLRKLKNEKVNKKTHRKSSKSKSTSTTSRTNSITYSEIQTKKSSDKEEHKSSNVTSFP